MLVDLVRDLVHLALCIGGPELGHLASQASLLVSSYPRPNGDLKQVEYILYFLPSEKDLLYVAPGERVPSPEGDSSLASILDINPFTFFLFFLQK